MTSSIYPKDTIADTELENLVINNGGTGFSNTASETTLVIDPPPSGGTQALASVTSVSLGVIDGVSLDDPGSGYQSIPNVTVIGTGSGANITVGVQINFLATENILASDVVITNNDVSPGGGGILRVYFSMTFSENSIVSVSNNGVFKGNLNADLNSQVVSNGYYRFDIDVESGDSINLQSSITVTAINLLRSHLVQFGA